MVTAAFDGMHEVVTCTVAGVQLVIKIECQDSLGGTVKHATCFDDVICFGLLKLACAACAGSAILLCTFSITDDVVSVTTEFLPISPHDSRHVKT